MKVEITCQKQWFDAQQKACELRDHSLNDCLVRVVSYATAKDWQVEEAKKASEKAYRSFSEANELFFKVRDTSNPSLYDRAHNLKWRLWEKYMSANNAYIVAQNGGNATLHITSDHAPLSFYWWFERPVTGWRNGKWLENEPVMIMNGGIIFSDRTNSWSIHT